MDIKICQKMNKIALNMIEKENNKSSRFLLKILKTKNLKV